MEDEYIISLYFSRDERAISETDSKYGKTCRRISANIVGNSSDAEECVNDTYLTAWNSIPPAKPRVLSAFIYKITRNLSLKRYEYNTAAKRNSYYDASFEELSDCLYGEDTESELTAQVINGFLQGLSKENRIIFLRRYWFSDSIRDISVRIGISEKAVTMRLTRTREALRKHLQKEGVIV